MSVLVEFDCTARAFCGTIDVVDVGVVGVVEVDVVEFRVVVEVVEEDVDAVFAVVVGAIVVVEEVEFAVVD